MYDPQADTVLVIWMNEHDARREAEDKQIAELCDREHKCDLCGLPAEGKGNHQECEDYENSPAWEMPDDVYAEWLESMK